jgi:glycosyltransferase involved in cell wall biosynthesis
MKIRFHSDCDYFAGCENMLANFLNDERMARELEVSFSYRGSTKYEEGLRARVRTKSPLIPLPLVDFYQISSLSNDWPAPLRVLYKILTRLLLVKYWIWLWDFARLFSSFAREKPDVVHINNGGFPGAVSCLAAAPAARLAGVPRVVHMINNLPVPYAGPDRWLDWPLDRIAVNATTKLVTASKFSNDAFARFMALSPDEAAVLPNGIADREITEEPVSVRRRLKIPENRPLIAVVAVLEPRKGHSVLFEALASLKKTLSPFPVTALGGDGTIRAELEEAARALGLADDVLFLGWEKKHFDLFNAADLVVLPSTGFEDFPNVILEAMSLGKPVVATKVGGIAEQIEDGKNGIVVAPGDAPALAKAVCSILKDPAFARGLGTAAAKRFRERFSAQASVARYIEFYKSLPGQK